MNNPKQLRNMALGLVGGTYSGGQRKWTANRRMITGRSGILSAGRKWWSQFALSVFATGCPCSWVFDLTPLQKFRLARTSQVPSLSKRSWLLCRILIHCINKGLARKNFKKFSSKELACLEHASRMSWNVYGSIVRTSTVSPQVRSST